MKHIKTLESYLFESEVYEDRFSSAEDEHNYLVKTKPKNTFKQLVEISKPMLKRFTELKAEDIIASAAEENDPSKTKKVKEEFKQLLMKDPEFWGLWSKKWNNPESVLSNLFHALYWYHFG